MMDIVNFKTLYLRTLLEFQSKGFRRSKCPIKKEEIVPIKDRVILYSLQILSLISVFVALTMVAFDMKFVFTAITLAVYVAAEAVFRIYLQRFMKRFDEKYFNMLVDKSKEEVQYQYRILQERKKYLFLSPLQLISNLIFLLALIILFAFNGKVYLLTIIGLCLLTVIVEGLHYHFTYKKKEQLEYEEKKLLNGHPIEMNNFLNMTYSLVGTYSIKNLINIVASVFGAVFLMLATNNETVNFVLFYFVAIYASLDRLGQVLNYLMLKEYDNKNEAMFRDTFL